MDGCLAYLEAAAKFLWTADSTALMIRAYECYAPPPSAQSRALEGILDRLTSPHDGGRTLDCWTVNSRWHLLEKCWFLQCRRVSRNSPDYLYRDEDTRAKTLRRKTLFRSFS